MKSALLLLTLGAVATANAQIVANGSFETSNVEAGNYRYSPDVTVAGHDGVVASPWTFMAGAGITDSNTAWGGVAEDGSYFSFLQTAGTSVSAMVSQTLTGLTAGSAYTVSFYSRQRPNYGQNSLSVVGTTALAILPAADWTLYTGTFVPTSSTFNLEFDATALTTGDSGSYIDNVSVTSQAVPEPASVAALGLGALGLLRRRRATR